jgi:hypothetical protein
MPKLALLRELKSQLALIEKHRSEFLANAPAEAVRVDREAASHALTFVIDYLDSVGAEPDSLRRLLAALHDTNAPMLAQRKAAGGQVGSEVSDTIRGKIAGVVHLRAMYFENGATRKAAHWVARHLPNALHQYLSPNPERSKRVTDRAIYEWYSKWGGEHGSKGAGRNGYLFVLGAGLKDTGQSPTEAALEAVLKHLARSPGVPQ